MMSTDKEQIQQTISHYADGGTNGEIEKVARAFHPSAYMKFAKENVLVDVPINDYLLNYIKPGIVQERTIVVNYIDITGTAAAVKLTIDYSTHQFVDYFNLVKTEGQWLIVSKIFHRINKQE